MELVRKNTTFETGSLTIYEGKSSLDLKRVIEKKRKKNFYGKVNNGNWWNFRD